MALGEPSGWDKQRLEVGCWPEVRIISQVGLFPGVSAAGEARTDALQKGLLCCWGHSLPDDRQRPWVFPPNLPVGCCAGEWPREMGLSAKELSISPADRGKGRVWWVAKAHGNKCLSELSIQTGSKSCDVNIVGGCAGDVFRPFQCLGPLQTLARASWIVLTVCSFLPGLLSLLSCGFHFSQLDPFHASLIIFLGRAWDAVTDPAIGFLVSKSPRTKYGKLVPW